MSLGEDIGAEREPYRVWYLIARDEENGIGEDTQEGLARSQETTVRLWLFR